MRSPYRMNQIILAMLAMSGRVTMLGISRWAGTGGSYRTILRFFQTVIPWATLFWLFFRKHLFRANEVYLLAGDEVVISGSGKYVVIINLGATTRIIMMNKIPDSTNMVI